MLMDILDSIIKREKDLLLKKGGFTVSSDERKRKVGETNSYWDPSLAENFGKEGEWLNEGFYARIGIAAALFCLKDGKPAVIMSRFNSTHPNRPDFLTPPAGLWTDFSSKNAALSKLAQEVILLFEKKAGRFLYKGKFLEQQWVEDWVKSHETEIIFSKQASIKDIPINDDENVMHIYIDGTYFGDALVQCEPDSGSIELIFLFKTSYQFDKISDGKKLPDGNWRNSWVGLLTVDELVNEKTKTTKAEAVEQFINNNQIF